MYFYQIQDIVQETNDFEVTRVIKENETELHFNLHGFETIVSEDWVTSREDIEDIKTTLINEIGEDYEYY
jgi:hypothetical protein